MTKPLLLDAFCGAGGATKGYQRAGFEVVGIDIKAQPHYCGDDFILGDALEVLGALQAGAGWQAQSGRVYRLADFDAIHASPPCQYYSTLRSLHPTAKHPALVDDTLGLLNATTMPYVVENVPGSPLHALTLCGSMFGLGCVCRDGAYRQLRRHRLFASSLLIFGPGACQHVGQPVGVYGHGGGGQMTRGYKGTLPEYREAMGMSWGTKQEIALAIPPAYSEWIGRQLLAVIEGAEVSA